MEKKIVVGISLGLLFVAFGFVSFLVIISKRHPYFVAKKIRVGALILSLSGIAVGCFGYSTCYLVEGSPAFIKDFFHIDQAAAETNRITVSFANSDFITGWKNESGFHPYAYMIIDVWQRIIMKGAVVPSGGASDGKKGEFRIPLGHALKPGLYELRLYTVALDSLEKYDWYYQSFPLKVKKK
jgi:hypothetical protein